MKLIKRNARYWAEKYRPVFFQEFKWWVDLIGTLDGLWRYDKPCIYYTAKEDDMYRYLYYFVYHPESWALGTRQHYHDFEGVLMIVNKKDPKDSYSISRSHFSFEFGLEDSRIWPMLLTIEAGGHGIKQVYFDPIWGTHTVPFRGNSIRYRNYKLINMATYRGGFDPVWEIFKKNHVQHPRDWVDTKMNNWLRKHRSRSLKDYGTNTTKGLWWDDPLLLLRMAKDMRLL